MRIKAGCVYRDQNGVSFLVTVEAVNTDTKDVSLRLVNVTNWVILAGHRATVVADGSFECKTLTDLEELHKLIVGPKKPKVKG